MTVMTHESFAGTPVRQGIAPRLLVPGFWAAVCIVTMWLAVLFDGIFGGNPFRSADFVESSSR